MSKSEDQLSRAPFAQHVVQLISSSPAEEGFVVALTGPWGSGKTSTLNMIVEALAPSGSAWLVVRFNPWMVTRPEELIGRFFQEVVASISTRSELKRSQAGTKLAQYAEALGATRDIPVLGKIAQTIGFVGRLGAWWANRSSPLRSSSVDDRRLAVEAALRAHGVRLLVVIDDLDRLGSDEVRDIIRLVRLIADFPRTVYLLAFDPRHVVSALGDDGQTYIEKIVQVPLDLPVVRPEDLDRLLFSELDSAIAGISTGPFDQNRWTDVYHRVVRPLIRNLRDVSRVANGLRPAVTLAGEEVCLVDLLALETVRVRLPAVYAQIYEMRELLTFTRSGFYGNEIPANRMDEMRSRLARLCDIAEGDREAVSELLKLVFPGTEGIRSNMHHGPESAREWRRERRVAHPEILKIYLDQAIAIGQVRPSDAARLFEALSNDTEFSSLLDDIHADHLEGLLGVLEDYEQDFPVVGPGVIVGLLRQLRRMRQGRKGMFDFGPDLAVDRVVLRLLRAIPDGDRLVVVRAAVDSIEDLSGKLALVRIVGFDENTGHRLIDRGDWEVLLDGLFEAVLAASPATLSSERDLGRLVAWANRHDAQRAIAALRPLFGEALVTVRLLGSLLGEAFSNTMGDMAVRRSTSLPWDFLTTVIGEDVATIVQRTAGSVDMDNLDPRDAEALALALRYAGGWRPTER